jgi:hypothetical protein
VDAVADCKRALDPDGNLASVVVGMAHCLNIKIYWYNIINSHEGAHDPSAARPGSGVGYGIRL